MNFDLLYPSDNKWEIPTLREDMPYIYGVRSETKMTSTIQTTSTPTNSRVFQYSPNHDRAFASPYFLDARAPFDVKKATLREIAALVSADVMVDGWDDKGRTWRVSYDRAGDCYTRYQDGLPVFQNDEDGTCDDPATLADSIG